MGTKKGIPLFIGLALLAIGFISLLATFNVVSISKTWWLPIILIIVGILVIMNSKGNVNILGWICLVYGAVLLLMTIGLFNIAFLWKLAPVSWILFGLILIL